VRQLGPPPELNVELGELAILGGCVVEPPAASGERERFVLELEPGARAQVTLYTRKSDEALPDLRYGQNVEMEARIRPPRNYGNPGAFDFAGFLARKDIYWTASGAAGTLRVLPGTCGSPFQKAVMDLRAAALERIARLYAGDEYATGMMQAILIGPRFQLQKVWTEQYRSTGTFHALVISGTHVAVLAGFFLLLLRFCLAPELLALLLTALATWLYALVTGWGAPVVRSAAGLTLFMIARYFYRERRPLNVLAAIALGFLVFDPEQLFEASFQLTFLAVACLGAFAVPLLQATTAPLTRSLGDLEDTDWDLHLEPRAAQFRVEMRLLAETVRNLARLPARAAALAVTTPAGLILFLFEVAVVSAIVQLGIALPMVVYFHRVGISGLSANILVVPVMALVMPVGFVTVFTGWRWAAQIGALLLRLSQAVVSWHARVEPNWRIPTPPLWLVIGFAAALIFAAATRRWPRIAAIGAASALLALLLWHPFPPETYNGELEVTAIDVGQGDGLLIAFPDGKRMIIDGGGIPVFPGRAPANLDTGEDVIAPYLWSRRISNVDVVALTHAHEDHIGGLPALLDDFHPKELWTGAMPDIPVWRKLQEHAARNGVWVMPMVAPRRFFFGGAEIEVLAPGADYQPRKAAENNDSLVLRIRYGDRSFLLCGDAERPIERRMLNDGEIEPADVLKVGHHGSKTSSTEEFLSAVRPEFAVISVGWDNSYGHPNDEVLDRLKEHQAAIFRTDDDGLVSIRTDGRRLRVETGRWLDTGVRLMNVF
jgi:competence protein ComEC